MRIYLVLLLCGGLFQPFKTFITDHMFYPAGIYLCSFRINTCCDKLFRKEAMTFINLFGHLAAHIGQMEKVIFIHCEKAAILQSR